MRRIVYIAGLCFVVATLLWAQRGRYVEPPPYEMKSVFPRELSPGKYVQVSQTDLQLMAEDGWELVSVMPYVYLNEERGTTQPKPIVTQTYAAYFFKRLKMSTGR